MQRKKLASDLLTTHKKLMTKHVPVRLGLSFSIFVCSILAAIGAETKPLRVLLITGGCCHDYAKQKDILKNGLEKRANIVVDQVHTDNSSTKPPLAILGNPDYAKGYDVVIHDECGADINDPATVE